MTVTFMKTRQEISRFALCIMAGILSGGGILLDAPLKWKAGSLAAFATAVLMLIAGRPRRILLLMLAFTTPFYFGKALIRRPEHLGLASGVGVSHTDILVLALLLLFSVKLALGQIEARFFTLITVPALAWLIFSSFSILAAGDGELVAFQLISMGQMLLLCWVVANSIENKVDVTWVITGFMLAMLFQAFVGIYQGATGHPLGLGFLTETAEVHKQELSVGLVSRVQGTLGHPNSYAMYLMTVIPFLLGFLFSKTRLLFKVLAGIMVCIGILALVFSLSRSAWINLLVIICIVLVLATRRKRIGLQAAIRLAGATALVLFGLSLFGPRIILSRLTSPDQGSAYVRITLAQTALAVIKDHPWVGVGLNNYSVVVPKYGAPLFGHSPLVHNAFLLIAAETGVVGLIPFLGFLAVLLIQTWRIIKSAPNDTVWVAGVGLFSAFVALALHSMTDYALLGSLVFTQFWLLAGLSAALIRPPQIEDQYTKHVYRGSNTMDRGFHSY